MTPQETPRTESNEAFNRLVQRLEYGSDAYRDVTYARDFARTLERDLGAANERNAALESKLHEIDCETEGDVDGAPDRSALSSLCNRIQNIIHPPR